VSQLGWAVQRSARDDDELMMMETLLPRLSAPTLSLFQVFLTYFAARGCWTATWAAEFRVLSVSVSVPRFFNTYCSFYDTTTIAVQYISS
jgi:hypothetical protein